MMNLCMSDIIDKTSLCHILSPYILTMFIKIFDSLIYYITSANSTSNIPQNFTSYAECIRKPE